MAIVYVTAPKYISLLFTERAGHVMLVVCVLWMGMGIMVMRKMMNFSH
jgi:tight adherence protein B